MFRIANARENPVLTVYGDLISNNNLFINDYKGTNIIRSNFFVGTPTATINIGSGLIYIDQVREKSTGEVVHQSTGLCTSTNNVMCQISSTTFNTKNFIDTVEL